MPDSSRRNALIVAMAREGSSDAEIAEVFGLSRHRVLEIRHAGGIKRPRGRKPGSQAIDQCHQAALVYERARQLGNMHQVGIEFGISRERVRQIVVAVTGKPAAQHMMELGRWWLRAGGKARDIIPVDTCASCWELKPISAGRLRNKRKSRFICKECSPYWYLVRAYIDPEVRLERLRWMARYRLKHPERRGTWSETRAREIAEGATPRHTNHLRGPHPGSAAWHALWIVRPDLARGYDTMRREAGIEVPEPPVNDTSCIT